MKLNNFINWIALASLGLGVTISAFAAETGTALKADTLRVQPFADAKSSGALIKNEPLEILTKKRGLVTGKN